MSLNLEVKSESWLDLSLGIPVPNRKQAGNDTYRYSWAHKGKEEEESHFQDYRHSFASYLPSSLSATTTGDNLNSSNSQREHLLIRLRQQSYLNSRSGSSASISSNLSKSIELNEVASSCQFSIRNQELESTKKLLKKTPARLSSIRNSLRSKAHQRAPEAHSKSPLIRSFSSLSERLSGQFSRFRLSCKHFLYRCNHEHSQAASTIETDFRAASASSRKSSLMDLEDQLMFSTNLNQLDKQELIDLWLERQYQEQWKVSSKRSSSQLPDTRLPQSKCKSNRNDRAQSLEVSAKNNVKNHAKVLSTCTGSSSLLKKEFPNQLKKNFTFEEKKDSQADYNSSSSTTLVSRSLESLNSSMTPVTTPLSSMSRSGSSNRLRVPDRTPTSDYWSAMTNEMNEDYYKRQQLRQAQDFAKTNSPLTINANRLALSCNQDQDYYLEVAKHEKQQQQQLRQELRADKLDEDALKGNEDASMMMMMYQRELDEDFEDYAVPADESCRLDRSQVELVQMIGEGQKGYVFLGKLQSKDGCSIQDVAIKTLKFETSQLIERLMREADMMRQLEHPHIIKFIGVCPETPALIAMELAEFGELKQFLRLNREILSSSQLVLFAFQISTALSYLESKQYVHRDVAARNVLVCTHTCVKLADFGLARNLKILENESSYDICAEEELQGDELALVGAPGEPTNAHYVASPRGKLPVRWLAPESLAFRHFTSASDVWMFGVFTWELFLFGQIRPWPNIRNNQVLLAIESGQRLAKPPACPGRLYQLLQRCWSYAPSQRPKFRELKQILWSIYLTERTREQLELERLRRAQQQHQVNQLEQQLRRQAEHQHATSVKMAPHLHNSRQHLLRLSASPLPGNAGNNATYSSYSSTATTHSNDDSSRSSTMNSLARQVRLQQPTLDEVDLASQKRFQNRAGNGHLLRKQRSQGSITVNQQQQEQGFGSSSNNIRYPAQSLFCETVNSKMRPLANSRDDFWISNSSSRQADQLEQQQFQKPNSDTRPVSFQFFYEPKLEANSRITNAIGDHAESCEVEKQEQLRLIENRLARLQVNNQAHFVEPAYEGVYSWQAGEVAMIRSGEVWNKQQNLAREPGCAQEPEQVSRSGAARVAAPTRQLLHFMKRSQPERHLAQVSHSKQQALQQKQSKSAERRNQVGEVSSGSCSSGKDVQVGCSEEQRQLAVHERLLGHIRPELDVKRKSSSSRGGCDKQNSTISDVKTAKQPATVEQSLELLESLIKEKNFNNTRQVSRGDTQHAGKSNKNTTVSQQLVSRLAKKRL